MGTIVVEDEKVFLEHLTLAKLLQLPTYLSLLPDIPALIPLLFIKCLCSMSCISYIVGIRNCIMNRTHNIYNLTSFNLYK